MNDRMLVISNSNTLPNLVSKCKIIEVPGNVSAEFVVRLDAMWSVFLGTTRLKRSRLKRESEKVDREILRELWRSENTRLHSEKA